MTTLTTTSRYSQASIALHWLMLIVIAAAYACIELRVLFERGTPERKLFSSLHVSLGLTVLALVIARIVARLRQPAPPIVPTPPGWQRGAAKLSHLLLYALMIGMPIAGWVLLSLRGTPITWFGLVELPALMAEHKDTAKLVREWHGLAGRIGYGLIALHALGAIYHHRVLRDNTLRRMMPAR